MKGLRFLLYARSSRYWINLLVTILIALGIAISIEIIGFNYNKRMDLTSEKRYEISDQFKKILNSLQGRIDVTVFYQSGERLELDDLLSQYAIQSPKFHYELYDLDRNPGMAKKYGIKSYGESVIIYGGKRTKVSYPVEDKIVNAILKLTRKEKKAIYFLKGHSENDITNDNPRKGYSKVREAIESEDYDVKELSLMKNENIPSNASVLIISGPKKDFLKEELETLHRFVQKEGKALFMIDPFYTFPNLSLFLSGYDVVLGNDVIVDQDNRTFGGDAVTILVPLFLKHPIIQDFRTPVLFPLARSVEVKGNPTAGVFAQTFAQSDPKSLALSDKKDLTKGKVTIEEGRKGPISVAAIVAIESKETKGEKQTGSLQEQIVVFGDSDFISNFYINQLGNKDLFLNTVNWLSEEDYLISSRPKRLEYNYRFLKYQDTKRLFWLLVILQPALPLAVGLVIYIRRKMKG
ncbi:MAG TPA: Gldg family protein [Thermodesulfobacteriota bacterium]|nr:Gldg family protein [Thermodesulfobacteriota bacterium]